MKYSKIAIMTLALLGASSQANSSMFSRAASFLKRPAQDAMIKATNKYPRFTAYVQKTDWLGVKVTLGLAAGGALCTTMGSGDPVLAPLGAIPILYMGLGLSMPLGLAITSATIGTCAMLKASHTMYYSR